MLRDEVERRLHDEHEEEGYLFPAYEDYCFANVPDTVLSVLGADSRRPLPRDVFQGVETDVDHVVVLLLDGFGYEHWKRDQHELPLLAELTEQGAVTPLTSIFPSETGAAITTMHTGQQPVEHGSLGWFTYVEEVDAVLQTLPFSTLDDEPAAEAVGADASMVLDSETVYERAAAAGIDAHVVQPERVCGSAYSGRAHRGADVTPYANLAEMALRVRQRLEAADDQSYVYAYVPHVDAAAHGYGTESDEYRAQLSAATECVRRELRALDPDVAARTLLVATADHGLVDTVPEQNVDLGTLDGVTEHLQRDADGEPIPAVGGARNAQFFVRQGHVEPLRERLEASLDVRTFDRAEQDARGLFGDREPSARFERRRPDLVAVHRDSGLWYDDGHLGNVGMHGGLASEEMLVPFATARVSRLQR